MNKMFATFAKFTPFLSWGAAVIATAFNVAVLFILRYGEWIPEDGAARIHALMMIALAQTIIIGIVVISWAWGRVENMNVNVAGNSISMKFDDGHEDKS